MFVPTFALRWAKGGPPFCLLGASEPLTSVLPDLFHAGVTKEEQELLSRR